MEKQYMRDLAPKGHGARICFGCGADNKHGLRIKSFIEGGDFVCLFTPKPHHTAFPCMVNGDIIASVFDCRGIRTAIGHYAKKHGINETSTQSMFVTREMSVERLNPTPMDRELKFIGRAAKMSDKSCTVHLELFVDDIMTAKSEVIAVRVT